MRLGWTNQAINDLESLRSYIEKDKPDAARNMVLQITTAAKNLVDYPNIGRPGRIPNTRELVVTGTPYILPYWMKRDTLEILRVLHGAMKWPE